MQSDRPTPVDALLGLAVFCLVAAAVTTDTGPAARSAVAYGFAVGFGALLLVSRRWPVAVLVATAVGIVAYYTLELPPIGLAAPMAAALFAAADRGRSGWAAGVAGCLLAVSVGVRMVEGDDPSIVLGIDLGATAVLMLAVIALGDAVRSRRALRAELDRQAAAAAEDRRREAARQVEAERVRIARELHDTLAHTMSVITLQSAVAEEALADGRPAGARTALAAIRAAGGSAMDELRATVGTLRRDAGTREPPPGLDRLDPLVDGVSRSGLPVDLRVAGDTGSLPAVVGTTAYRVVQEALTNALRHSGASRVTVIVEVAPGELRLEILDDGRGAPHDVLDSGPGHGLRGMSERVALLGGAVDAGNAEGGGFRVRAHLPLTRRPA